MTTSQNSCLHQMRTVIHLHQIIQFQSLVPDYAQCKGILQIVLTLLADFPSNIADHCLIAKHMAIKYKIKKSLSLQLIHFNYVKIQFFTPISILSIPFTPSHETTNVENTNKRLRRTWRSRRIERKGWQDGILGLVLCSIALHLDISIYSFIILQARAICVHSCLNLRLVWCDVWVF